MQLAPLARRCPFPAWVAHQAHLGHGSSRRSRGVPAGRTGPSNMLAPTAETRRELSTAADDCVSSLTGVPSASPGTTAYNAKRECCVSTIWGHSPTSPRRCRLGAVAQPGLRSRGSSGGVLVTDRDWRTARASMWALRVPSRACRPRPGFRPRAPSAPSLGQSGVTFERGRVRCPFQVRHDLGGGEGVEEWGQVASDDLARRPPQRPG